MIDPNAPRDTNISELRDIIGRAMDSDEPNKADAKRAVTLGFLLVEYLLWDIYRIAEALTAREKRDSGKI
jgi:hypothetical protein